MDHFSETTGPGVISLKQNYAKLESIITTLHTNKKLMQPVFKQAYYSRKFRFLTYKIYNIHLFNRSSYSSDNSIIANR